MLGAIIGDIVGSRFEFNNHRSKEFELFTSDCKVTDDTIMTLAIAQALLDCDGNWDQLCQEAVKQMRALGNQYPDAGYGGRFQQWLRAAVPEPYNSYGNGAAMRVSPCALIARSEEEAKLLSRKVTEVTHNHPEGISGAEATTLAIYLACHGATKKEIRERIEANYYSLNFSLDQIRPTYEFNETCQDTVPQAIVAFLESSSFEDAVRNAISIGGDSDTLAAITGAIAEGYYGIPSPLCSQAISFLDKPLRSILHQWEVKHRAGRARRKFDLLSKYAEKLADIENEKEFYNEFTTFVALNPQYGWHDYQNALEKFGLLWNERSMKAANVGSLPEEAVLMLITGVMRADHFGFGTLETFIKEGYLTRWLERLRLIDDEREPEPLRPALTKVTIVLRPFSEGVRSELMLTENQLVLKNSTAKGANSTHSYEFSVGADSALHALAAMEECLLANGWQDVQFFDDVDFAFNLFELEAVYEDGTEARHKGVFDRAHIPEKPFYAFIDSIRMIIQSSGFGGIVSLTGFLFAIKKGEVKYCGVQFSDGGKVYHYRTTDLRIEAGDEVIVPVGPNNKEREGFVVSVEFCRWDDTPYPLEKTKEIIRMATDTEPSSVYYLDSGESRYRPREQLKEPVDD